MVGDVDVGGLRGGRPPVQPQFAGIGQCVGGGDVHRAGKAIVAIRAVEAELDPGGAAGLDQARGPQSGAPATGATVNGNAGFGIGRQGKALAIDDEAAAGNAIGEAANEGVERTAAIPGGEIGAGEHHVGPPPLPVRH